MPDIKVYVGTAGALDTKFLFPGTQPGTHLINTQASPPADFAFIFGTVAYRHGAPATGPMSHMAFWIKGTPSSSVDGSAVDFGGRFTAWQVHEADSDETLGDVFVTKTGNDTPADLVTQSFASLTLDGAVSTLLSRSEMGKVYLYGNVGNDTLRGSFWHDQLDGGQGKDTMIGGDGDDRYYVDSKKDKVVEAKGEGRDAVFTKIDYTLGKYVESVYASGSRDFTLTGNSAANGLEGSTGADTLKGLDGADALAGWGGKDVLYGGKGKDSFIFVTNPQFDKPDTIKDFNHADDTIKVLQTAFVGLVPNVIAGSNFALPEDLFHASTSGKAHDATDRILYDTDDGKLYFDPDGTGGQARVLFANLTDHPKVLADDIWVL